MMYMITFRARNPESGPEVVEKIDRSIKALGPKSAGFFENVWMVNVFKCSNFIFKVDRINIAHVSTLLKNEAAFSL